jgi:hypothetical protein
MIKIQKSKPNRHKIYLLENCPSSINNREVLICNDYICQLNGSGVGKLYHAIDEAYTEANKELTTSYSR